MHLFDEDKIKAVAYYRHSAEDKQENSVSIQREQVERFAERENIQILEHFKDEGISGLTANRPGFQEMFSQWVTNHSAEQIDYILVYDASRFGRFQEMSEVWHWLGLCSKRDIKLASVTRGLPRNETSAIDSFIITLDFSMSGEFSKILSEKVAYGSMKVAEQGYSPGGTAPYGYSRVLLSEQRERIGILQRGEHKLISNQRVSLEPALNDEADVVKRIFDEFVSQNNFPADIADDLNREGIVTATGRQWTASGINKILSNETYMGTRVYNKTWKRLKAKKMRHNPSAEWIRCLDAHQALVDSGTFHKAQERMYWLNPRARSGDASQLKTTMDYVWRFINNQLIDWSDDQKFYVKRSMPVVFASAYQIDGLKQVCFYIPSEFKKYDQVIGWAIDTTEDSGDLTAAYLIDTDNLGYSNYFITSLHNDDIQINTEQLPNSISAVGSHVIEQKAPWVAVAA